MVNSVVSDPELPFSSHAVTTIDLSPLLSILISSSISLKGSSTSTVSHPLSRVTLVILYVEEMFASTLTWWGTTSLWNFEPLAGEVMMIDMG